MEDKFNTGGTKYVVDGVEMTEEEYVRLAAPKVDEPSGPAKARGTKEKEVTENAVA